MPSPSTSIVLITGANQGIGYAVAEHLVKAGTFHVLLGSRDMSKGSAAALALDPSGTIVEPIQLDVNSDSSITAAAAKIASTHGRLDALVNNAGINNEMDFYMGLARTIQAGQKPESLTPPLDLAKLRKDYTDAFNTNLFGVAAVTEAMTPLLEKATAKPARIVFVSSHTGSLGLRSDESSSWHARMSRPSFPIYRSGKAALNMLTLHYAAVHAEKGWKINASCPNLTDTAFTGSSGMGRPASESALNIVRLLSLGEDGENGTCSDESGVVPW